MAHSDNEFYIGYDAKSPAGIARYVKIVVLLLLVLFLGVAFMLASTQREFDVGTFEFGVETPFEGTIIEKPYPILLEKLPSGEPRSHYLVSFGKFDASDQILGMDGRAVRLTGARIYNEQRQMIEVVAGSAQPIDSPDPEAFFTFEQLERVSLGKMSFRGEIVDSKCHLGVMKPGRQKPHRACAVRCISGGIPPVLRVENEQGELSYLLITDAEGEAVNDRVLDLVAEPVEIEGQVYRVGDQWVLRADPSTYRRL